jgi:multimeric flavodoxin WrbA
VESVILDGFENESPIGTEIKFLLERQGHKSSYFKLKDMNIMPCRSCGSCGIKTPGKCIIKDDMDEVLRAIAKSKLYIMLTPITFGGYSSQLKKAVDRTMPIGIPFYKVSKGHLLHPMRYGDKALLGIGICEGILEGQEENFKLLQSRNALNMSFSYNKALVFKASNTTKEIEASIVSTLSEVNQLWK